MDIILAPLLHVIFIALDFYMMGLFVYGVLYLLQSLDVLKKQNPLVFKIQTALFALYEPVLSPIRQLIPVRVDLSMITLYLILYFVREVIRKIVAYFPL
jgi:uncharacterized protein YggT (Ycf19 family)